MKIPVDDFRCRSKYTGINHLDVLSSRQHLHRCRTFRTRSRRALNGYLTLPNKRTLRRKNGVSNATKKRTLKRAQDAAAKEQRSIERMLGEEFDSLSQARRALKAESVPVRKRGKIPAKLSAPKLTPKTTTKPAPKQSPKSLSFREPKGGQFTAPKGVNKSRKSYTFRELTKGEKGRFADWFKDSNRAYNFSKGVDQLLKPGEHFAASEIPWKVTLKDGSVQTGIAKSKNIYPNAYTMFESFAGYAARNDAKGVSSIATQRWLNSIQIVKFAGTQNQWEKRRNK